MSLVLTDTTVLNNFSQVRRSDLLRNGIRDLAAPIEVREELAAGERLGRVPACDWSWLRLIELSPDERARADELRGRLEAGEAACIAVVLSRGGLLLTDDRVARQLAVSLNLEVSGTLGILHRLVQREVLTLDEADELLVEMMAQGYRSPFRSLREIDS